MGNLVKLRRKMSAFPARRLRLRADFREFGIWFRCTSPRHPNWKPRQEDICQIWRTRSLLQIRSWGGHHSQRRCFRTIRVPGAWSPGNAMQTWKRKYEQQPQKSKLLCGEAPRGAPTASAAIAYAPSRSLVPSMHSCAKSAKIGYVGHRAPRWSGGGGV